MGAKNQKGLPFSQVVVETGNKRSEKERWHFNYVLLGLLSRCLGSQVPRA